MSQLIPVKVSWSDNSSGSSSETGTEIDIYSDSPSFVPNVPVDPASGVLHAWMRLRPVAAGEVEAQFNVELPVTFVTVRVRQYNANGPGPWSSPAGHTFAITPQSGTNVPPSPSNLGFAVVGSSTPPPPPVTPPPPPPPVGGGGSASNYVFASQFSGTQGLNQWSYLDSAGNNLTYDSAGATWRGDELYLAIWNGGFHHGASGSFKGAVLRWTAPSTGTAIITGSHRLYETGSGATLTIKHGATTIYTQAMTGTTVYNYSESESVTAGDVIDFILTRDATGVNNNTSLAPTIQMTSDGSTPTAPILASLTPSTVAVQVGGVQPLTVALSSAATAATTVSLSSSDTGKVTVPASIVIPIGVSSGIFNATGVAAGTSTLTATYSGVNKTSAATVSAPVSGTWNNIPAGYSLLNSHGHESLTSDGWQQFDNGTGSSVVSDATAPVSPPSVLQQRFPAGLVGGNGGGGSNYYGFPAPKNACYWGFMFKTDSNYENHPVLTKIAWIHTYSAVAADSNSNQLFLAMEGSGPFFFTANYQNSNIDNGALVGFPGVLGTIRLYPASGGEVYPGQWAKIEMVFVPSTTNVSQDGKWLVWVNGVLIHQLTTLNTGRIQPNGVSHITIWGGTGTVKQRDSYIWYDHSIVYTP